MKSYLALIAVGLDAAATRFSSKIKKTAAAVVAGVVGIGLLASPFLLRADHDGSVDTPQVNCIWVENHGSIGFDVKFDVSNHPDSDELLSGFELWQSGEGLVDDAFWVMSTSLFSDHCGWLEIPGFDGGPPLPYPGYSHSFDFTVKGFEFLGFFSAILPDFDLIHSLASSVSVQLYVDVDSEGALESMSAWAVDSGGGSYEVPVYYSPGGSENFRTFED